MTISVRIFCHICGHENICSIPIGTLDKINNYRCGNCSAHLFELQDIKKVDYSFVTNRAL
jgi:transcription elongation factor Elf1